MYIHERTLGGVNTVWDADINITGAGGGDGAIGRINPGASGGGENSEGDVSEILIFDSDMSQQDFDATGLYLAQKYGFAAFGHDGTVLGGGPAVPEPSSGVLAILGILGLVATARRRRRRAAA